MFNLPQNPILFWEGLWLYNRDGPKEMYAVNKRKRKLVRKVIRNILLFLK